MKGRIPFIIFFLYLILAGALRKWYLPSMGTPILLVQYLLLYVVYVTLPKGSKQFTFTPAFQGILGLYILYGFLEIFNLRGTTNIIVQLYGFAMHFSFIPLIFFMPRILSDEKTFDKLLKGLSFAMLGLFFLGITQYFSPTTSFINKYAVDAAEGSYEVAIGGGGRARITGTFSYLAIYASFLCFILHILFYGTVVSLIQKKFNWYFIVAFGMGVINLFMTGSRGSTVFYFLTESSVLILMTLGGQAKFLKNLIPLAAILIIGFFISQATEAGSTATGDFFGRLTGLNDIDGRLDDAFAPFKFYEYTGPVGYGIGTAQFPMEQYLTNRWEMPGYWEEEGERITIELGTIGYIIVMIFRYSVFFSCFILYRKIKKLEYKILALTMTMYQLPFLLNLQTNIYNYIDGIFYYMAIGVVYFALYLDRKKESDTDPKPKISPVNMYKWN